MRCGAAGTVWESCAGELAADGAAGAGGASGALAEAAVRAIGGTGAAVGVSGVRPALPSKESVFVRCAGDHPGFGAAAPVPGAEGDGAGGRGGEPNADDV